MRGCSEDMTSGKGLCSGLCAVASLISVYSSARAEGWTRSVAELEGLGWGRALPFTP